MGTIAAGAKGGLVGLVRQPDRIGYDPVRGASRWAVWRALDMDLINDQADVARALFLPYNVSTTGTTHTIEIEIVGGTTNLGEAIQPTDRWEMPANELQKSIWEHKNLSNISTDSLSLAQSYVQNGQSWADFIADPSLPIEGMDVGDIANFLAAYKLEQRGATHYAFGQYVLRHVSNAPAWYSENIADVNVEKLYTTAQLLAEVTNPLLWSYPLPPAMVYRIQHIAAPATRPDYLWSWRKLPSGVSTAAGGRVEFAMEYWLEQWSTLLYEAVA